jgi:Ca2+-binding EF-hand superfamily protein
MKPILLIPALTVLLSAGAAEARQDTARAMFAESDVNNDGRLSRLEFDAARETLFGRADGNHDGRLTLQELRALRPENAPQPRRRPGREQLARLRSIDANNDRAVDLREFRAIGERQFANADTSRDGFISREEMVNLVRALGIGQ